MLSAKDEKNAVGAVMLFNFLHYALRSWPWLIVALASLIVFPDLESIKAAFPNAQQYVQNDTAYPAMMSRLPSGWLGLVAASLIAAYMSTIATHLNWGASYLVQDFYVRFVNPKASPKNQVLVGRLCMLLLLVACGVMALILQPHILTEIAGDAELSRVGALTKGLVMTFYGPTAIETGSAELNELVSTGGMAGMLNTIWLIVCAMCFGAAMVASGMIESITKVVISWVRSRVGLVASTASTGLFLNVATGDQFISIVLTVNMFKDVYKRQGYEARLVSRTAEDSATVTSVLVPWNTCGLTQSTVLGVATIAYLPYCFFNILSPLMTILVAAVGWKIRRKMRDEK
jgi:Na+/H+ antiporter NhaC